MTSRTPEMGSLLAVVCLLTFSGGVLKGTLVLKLLLYAAVLWHVFPHRKRLWEAARAERWLMLFAVWAGFTLLWSQLPLWSARRWLGLAGGLLVGLWMGCSFTLRQRLRHLAVALGIAGILSLLMVAVAPSAGRHMDGIHLGLWKGIYTHKNVLGRVMGLAVLTQFLLAVGDRAYRKGWLSLLALCSVLLVLSGSKAALGACALALLCLAVGWVRETHWWFSLASLFLAVCFGGYISWVAISGRFISAPPAEGGAALVTEIDLQTGSGRLNIWTSSLRHSLQTWLVGSGYDAFWIDGGPGEQVRDELKWSCRSAHNGFIELWLNTGLVGLLLALVGLWAGVRGCVTEKSDSMACWAPAWWVYFLVVNLFESEFLEPHSLFLVVYAAVLYAPDLPSGQGACRTSRAIRRQ